MYKFIGLYIKESVVDIQLTIKATKLEKEKPLYFLLNDCITFSFATLNDRKFEYMQKTDTLFFFPQEQNMVLKLRYEMPYLTMLDCKRPILADSNQIFFERYYRWYPVLYDNFAKYQANIFVPDGNMVFAYTSADSIINANNGMTYCFMLYGEDFPMVITKNIFHCETIKKSNIDFNFYFIPGQKRLLTVTNNTAIWATEAKQKDSLLSILYQRAIDAVEWYNHNLWQKEIKHINFIESTIDGMGCGLGFIFIDKEMINRDLFHKTYIGHEIAHIWMGTNLLYEAKGKYFIGESIPEYVNLLFYESWAGESALDEIILQTKDNTKSNFTITFEELLGKRKHTDDISLDAIYQKGPAFVHEFCKLIGKEKLLKIIRETYSLPNHLISLEDFERSIKANNCWNEYLKLYDIEL